MGAVTLTVQRPCGINRLCCSAVSWSGRDTRKCFDSRNSPLQLSAALRRHCPSSVEAHIYLRYISLAPWVTAKQNCWKQKRNIFDFSSVKVQFDNRLLLCVTLRRLRVCTRVYTGICSRRVCDPLDTMNGAGWGLSDKVWSELTSYTWVWWLLSRGYWRAYCFYNEEDAEIPILPPPASLSLTWLSTC